MVTVRCTCGEVYQADEAHRDRSLRCRCGRALTIGSSEAVETVGNATPHADSEPPKHAEAGTGAPHTPGPPSRAGAAVLIGALAIALIATLSHVDAGSGLTAVAPGHREGRPPSPTPDVAIGHGTAAPAAAPAPAPCPTSSVLRPTSGRELMGFSSRGRGRLAIDNGTGNDAKAILVRASDNRPYRAIFIRDHEVGLFTHIAEGRYYLRFGLGTEWLPSRRFCHVLSSSQFVEPLGFSERYTEEGVRYKEVRVTLQPVPGGTARTKSIDPTELELPPRGGR